ncbi:hypothetical protein LRS13_00035 [Svornostia abyssi]|uniref:Uncharacterized protein n=1 Tax=Svornostia abyssi TaxID=2898438 RepID=A0ABY5PH51_9ACTN|nr:hypothetical protein LRS13_00035 [Parviterribacteraceae bacterium J379]
MSDWTNPDVTPVGGAAGARADQSRPAPLSGGEDPFGSRPSRRSPGWVRVILGVLLVVASIALIVVGIGKTVESGSGIESDAVARGEVRESVEQTRAVTFVVPPGERRDYTVYLLLTGRDGFENRRDLTVRDTACVAELPDGVQTRFRGARQGASTTIGKASSVGHFSAQPGRVAVVCAYTQGTRSSRRIRPETAAYVVTPGTPGAMGLGIAMIVGGATVLIGAGFLIAWGMRRRKTV